MRERKLADAPQPPDADPITAAKSAGLRYVEAGQPGLARRRKGKSFSYHDLQGRVIRDPDHLLRIRELAIPPAWEGVWICPDGRGHIQAVGRDERGRKQYRYHARWREVRDETKYEKMLAFVHALPRIRARTRRDLKLPGLPRDKVLATVVRLLETTLIRVGNDQYADSNESYGLTTMQNRHVKRIRGGIHFRFKGKSGVSHAIELRDPKLAKIVLQCQDLPGAELLQYVEEDGSVRDIGSSDVNAYLREITGQDFTAKDFRTWAGTVLAAMALREFETVDSQAAMKKNILSAIDSVAQKLGNTRAVCRKCYVHPAILDSYLDGETLHSVNRRLKKVNRRLASLRPEEAAVLVLLQKRLARSPSRPPRRRRIV